MEQMEKEVIREASVEVSHEFKTLIDSQDLDSLKQLQHLMYCFLSLSLLTEIKVLIFICFNNYIGH